MYSKGSVIVLELPERLDQSEVATFLNVLQPLLGSQRSGVVLDCSKVQHIDSIGVEMLLACLEDVTRHDGGLKFAGVSPASAIILDLMRIEQLFKVFETLNEAADSFQSVDSLAKMPAPQWDSGAYTSPP